MSPDATGVDALASRLSPYDRAVEIGVGDRPDLASALARAGVTVTATDVRPVSVPEPVRFVRDDVVERAERVPEAPGPFRDADLVYARRLPPELHRSALAVARAVGADLRFTTLGADPPAVPVAPESYPGGTLYRPRRRG